MLQNVRKSLPGRRPHVTHSGHLGTLTHVESRIRWGEHRWQDA